MIELVVLIPAFAALLCLIPQIRPRHAEAIALLGAVSSSAALLLSAASSGVISSNPITGLYGMMRMDALGLLFTGVTSTVALFVFLYSISYMREEVHEGVFKEERLGRYYSFMLFFLVSMLLVTMASDLLTTWAALESTTLASVFLISFYDNKESVEAAWKYFIICSLGITIALVGLMILAYGMQQAGVQESFAWENALANAQKINPLYLKIAFAFIFVGYGTKVGLVPLHVWLPDAHSQAPTPVSALLSGVLLNAALYSILRLYPIAAQNPGALAFISSLFVFFGLISLALASLRLFSQENYKRLLAYSSVENMGIICLGIGIGGPLGLLAALFHTVSHSLIKPLAFFIGGMISLAYGTKEISKITGIAQKLPLFGQMFVLVNVGITGSLPFGTFISEVILIAAALSSGNLLIAALLVVFTTVAFGSFLQKSSHMAFGPFTTKVRKYEPDLFMKGAIFGLFALAIAAGLLIPQALIGIINPAVAVLMGG